MRSTLHVLLMVVSLLITMPLVAQKKAKKKKGDVQPAMVDTTTMQGGGGGEAGAFPYMAEYSSRFTMGNQEHARMVLSIWKDYDDNRLDRSAVLLADTVMMQLPDGQIVRGKDSVMTVLKQYRGQFTSVKSTVDAWLPMRSTDRNEDWVLVWGTEKDTNASGTTSTVIHEIWRVNRDGKIDFMRQYAAKSPVQ